MALLFLVMTDVGGRIRSQTPAAQEIRVLVDSHLMMSKHVNGVCKSAFFPVSNIGRIEKYLDRDKCFLLYLKLKLSFLETDCSLPVPLDLGNALPVDIKNSEPLNILRSKVRRLLFR